MGGPMRCGSAPLDDGVSRTGKITDPASVGTALKRLLARTEITGTRGLVAISDALATFRILRLPPGSADKDVEAAVARELALDPERVATQWLELPPGEDHRVVYAVAWDRLLVKSVTESIRSAGLDVVAVELKSLCVARTVSEPACIVLDVSAEPGEIILIDGHVPQVWHTFELPDMTAGDVAAALAAPVRAVLRFIRGRAGLDFGPTSPVLIAGEQDLLPHVLAGLSELVQQPVLLLPAPPRVPLGVRHSTYLTCLGLLMRRAT